MSEEFVAVGIADIKVGRAPLRIRTTLGSCIAVCLYSQSEKAGGMLHFMMASPPPSEEYNENMKRAKYAETGIQDLLKIIKTRFGLETNQLTAKIFGGANILQTVTNKIGTANDEAARRVLRECGIRLLASKTGGNKGYKVDMDLETGKVICQVFGEEPLEF